MAPGLDPGELIWVPDFDQPVSSREVRAILAGGGDASDALPFPVAEYIRDRGLYRS